MHQQAFASICKHLPAHCAGHSFTLAIINSCSISPIRNSDKRSRLLKAVVGMLLSQNTLMLYNVRFLSHLWCSCMVSSKALILKQKVPYMCWMKVLRGFKWYLICFSIFYLEIRLSPILFKNASLVISEKGVCQIHAIQGFGLCVVRGLGR